jgi:hypothetical protein
MPDDQLLSISVEEDDDGNLILEWDESDPRAAVINTWTEQDWIDTLVRSAKDTLEATGESVGAPEA